MAKVDRNNFKPIWRDSQRQKVYRTEHLFWALRPEANRLISLEEAEALRAAVWLIPERDLPAVAIRRILPPHFKTRTGTGATSHGGVVSFAKDYIKPWVVLHELAHELCPLGARHGEVWVAVYLWLVERFFSFATREKLAQAFRHNKIKIAILARRSH